MPALLLLALSGCAHRVRIQVEREPAADMRDAPVAAPLFLVDHDEGDPFRRNTAVGNFTFSGGYVTETVGSGLHNVSREVRLDEAERYRGQAVDWLARAAGATAQPLAAPPPPRRVERRGTSRLDGRDNVSLPRFDLVPQAGGSFDRPTWVPWVVTYATHNGGWFHGQEYGTAGGARVRLLFVAHAPDGSVLGWLDLDGSRLSDREFSPTGPQLEDHLLALERRLGRRLP